MTAGAENADEPEPGFDFTDPNSPWAPYYFQASHVLAGVLLAVCLVFFSSMTPLVHSDLWGHLKFGEYLVNERQFPPHEMFSPYSDPQAAYVPFMWLSQSFLYVTYSAGAALAGPAGGGELLRSLHALIVCGKLLLLLLAYRRASGSMPLAVAGLALLLVLHVVPFSVQRPQALGELCFAWLLFLLSNPAPTWRTVTIMVLAIALWANLHGSFVLGFVLLSIFIAGRTLQFGIRDEVGGRWSVALGAALFVVGLTHPFGFGIYRAALEFGGNYNVRTLEEWLPLDFHRAAGGHWGYLAILALLAGSQALSPRTLTPTALLLTLTFGIGPLFQERLMAWWVLLAPWILLPLWPARICTYESVPSLRKTLFSVALGAITLLWTGAGQLLLGNQPVALQKMVTPVTLVELPKELQQVPGKIFTPDNLGDYPIWRHGKEAPVLVYSHAQYFPRDHWDDFMVMLTAKPGWEDLFDRHGVNIVWIDAEKQGELAQALRGRPEQWRVVVAGAPGGAFSPFKLFVAVRIRPL